MGKCHNYGKQGIKLLSVGVVVRFHVPTEDQYTNRQLPDNKNLKKINRRLNFRIYRMP